MAQKHRASKALVTFKIKEISFLNDAVLVFFSCPTSQLRGVPGRILNLYQLQLTLRANEQRFYLYARCSVCLRHNSYLTLPLSYIASRLILPWNFRAHMFARKQCILFFKGRYDHRSSNCNLSNCKLTRKKFRDFNWIRTRSLCQLALQCSNQWSYENPYIGSRAIC